MRNCTIIFICLFHICIMPMENPYEDETYQNACGEKIYGTQALRYLLALENFRLNKEKEALSEQDNPFCERNQTNPHRFFNMLPAEYNKSMLEYTENEQPITEHLKLKIKKICAHKKNLKHSFYEMKFSTEDYITLSPNFSHIPHRTSIMQTYVYEADSFEKISNTPNNAVSLQIIGPKNAYGCFVVVHNHVQHELGFINKKNHQYIRFKKGILKPIQDFCVLFRDAQYDVIKNPSSKICFIDDINNELHTISTPLDASLHVGGPNNRYVLLKSSDQNHYYNQLGYIDLNTKSIRPIPCDKPIHYAHFDDENPNRIYLSLSNDNCATMPWEIDHATHTIMPISLHADTPEILQENDRLLFGKETTYYIRKNPGELYFTTFGIYDKKNNTCIPIHTKNTRYFFNDYSPGVLNALTEKNKIVQYRLVGPNQRFIDMYHPLGIPRDLYMVDKENQVLKPVLENFISYTWSPHKNFIYAQNQENGYYSLGTIDKTTGEFTSIDIGQYVKKIYFNPDNENLALVQYKNNDVQQYFYYYSLFFTDTWEKICTSYGQMAISDSGRKIAFLEKNGIACSINRDPLPITIDQAHAIYELFQKDRPKDDSPLKKALLSIAPNIPHD